MQVKSRVLDFFNLKKEEAKIIVWLLCYSFALGLATAFFYTPALSLFLQYFARESIAYGYIIGGASVFILVEISKKLLKGKSSTDQLQYLLYFLLISSFILITTFLFVAPFAKILVFIFFIWIRINLYVINISFWGVASKLFDLRQAKKYYSLVGAGEVLSYIISFFSIPVLLSTKIITTAELLYFAIGGMGIALIIARRIFKLYGSQINTQRQKSNTQSRPVQTNTQKKYFRQIYIISIFPVLAVTFVEYIFFAQSQIVFKGQGEMLSSFIAIFFGFAAIVEFVIKTFLSAKLIEKFGLKFGLIALPGMLLISYIAIVCTGTIPVLATIYFAFIALSRLFLRAFRASFNDPAIQFLFLPIPEEYRLQFQQKVEGRFKAIGTLGSGIVLLSINYIPQIDIFQICIFFLLLSIVWVLFTRKTHIEYKKNLTRVLQLSEDKKVAKLPIKIDLFTKLDSDTHNKYLFFLSKTDYKDFLVILKNNNQNTSLFQPNILGFYAQNNDVLEQLIPNNSYHILKGIRNNKFKQSALFHATNTNRKIKIIRLLSTSKRYIAYKLLLKFLKDTNPLVTKESLLALGSVRQTSVYQVLVNYLTNTEFVNEALQALGIQSPKLTPYLINFLNINNLPPLVFQCSLGILAKHQNPDTIKFFREKSFSADYRIRNIAIQTIANFGILPDQRERAMLTQLIDDEVNNIIQFANFIYLEKSQISNELFELIQNERSNKIKNIFCYLSVLFDDKIIKLIEKKIQSQDASQRSFALEILDTTISENIKEMVLPIFEYPDPGELIAKHQNYRSEKQQNCEKIYLDLINIPIHSIDLRTRIALINQISHTYPGTYVAIIKAFISHPNYIVSDFAIQAYHLANPDACSAYMAHFKTSILAAIYQNYKLIAENKLIPKIHIIQQIQQLEIFQDLSYDDLSEVANGSEICKTQHELRCKECLIWIKKGNFSINNIPIDESNRLIWYKADTPEILSALEEGIALITNITPVLLLLNIYPEILQKFSKYVSIYSKQGTNVRITFH